jgi:hypothetical protein
VTLQCAPTEPEAITGKAQAPCLVVGNRSVPEAVEIMKYFAERTTKIGGEDSLSTGFVPLSGLLCPRREHAAGHPNRFMIYDPARILRMSWVMLPGRTNR